MEIRHRHRYASVDNLRRARISTSDVWLSSHFGVQSVFRQLSRLASRGQHADLEFRVLVYFAPSQRSILPKQVVRSAVRQNISTKWWSARFRFVPQVLLGRDRKYDKRTAALCAFVPNFEGNYTEEDLTTYLEELNSPVIMLVNSELEDGGNEEEIFLKEQDNMPELHAFVHWVTK